MVLVAAFAIFLVAALASEALLPWWVGGVLSAILLCFAGVVAAERRSGLEGAFSVNAIGQGPWRDGRCLVTRLDHPLPRICVASGNPSDRTGVEVIEVAPTIARWASLLTLCSFFQGAVSRAVTVSLPRSDSLTPVRRRRQAVGVLYLCVAAAVLAAFCTVDLAQTRWLAPAPVLALFLFVRGAKRVFDPIPLPFGVRMVGDVLWLRRVHPAVLEGLPVLHTRSSATP